METIYVIITRNLMDKSTVTHRAYRSYESAVAERDRLNKKWEGIFDHSIDIISLD